MPPCVRAKTWKYVLATSLASYEISRDFIRTVQNVVRCKKRVCEKLEVHLNTKCAREGKRSMSAGFEIESSCRCAFCLANVQLAS